MPKLLHAHRAPYGGTNTETLAAGKTLVTYSPKFQRLNPNGSDRVITLPSETASAGLWFVLSNTGTSGNLTVNSSTGTLLVSVNPAQAVTVSCDGTTWTLSGTSSVTGGATVLAAAGTALTGSNTETVLASATIPASRLTTGSRVRVKYQGIVSATTGATTLTIKLRFGTTTLTGTAIISGTATTTAANLIFSGEADITCRATPSATSACVAHALFCEPTAAGAVTPKQAIMASTNFATNGALLVEVTGTWSASDANSCRVDIFNVNLIG